MQSLSIGVLLSFLFRSGSCYSYTFHIKTAEGLKDADTSSYPAHGLFGGVSDPFCALRAFGPADRTVFTERKLDTLDPVWEEQFVFSDTEDGNGAYQGFMFQFFDADATGMELLGQTRILYANDFECNQEVDWTLDIIYEDQVEGLVHFSVNKEGGDCDASSTAGTAGTAGTVGTAYHVDQDESDEEDETGNHDRNGGDEHEKPKQDEKSKDDDKERERERERSKDEDEDKSRATPTPTGSPTASYMCDPASHFVIGTATADLYPGFGEAFEYEVIRKDLVQSARSFPGNVFYYFTKSITEDNRYQFVESWESVAAAQTWITSDVVRDVFNNYTYSMMTDDALTTTALLPLPESSECIDEADGVGAIQHTFHGWNGCQDFYQDVINVSSCGWLITCSRVEVLNENDKRIYFTHPDFPSIRYNKLNETIHSLNPSGSMIEYEVWFYAVEIERTIQMTMIYDAEEKRPDQCLVLYKYWSDPNVLTIEWINWWFHYAGIPYIQASYQVDDTTQPDEPEFDEHAIPEEWWALPSSSSSSSSAGAMDRDHGRDKDQDKDQGRGKDKNRDFLCNPQDHYVIGDAAAYLYDGFGEAFQYEIIRKDLVQSAREFDGNQFYYFTKNLFHENEYHFIDSWESVEAAEEWITGEVMSDVFYNYTNQMMEEPMTFSALSPLPESSECINKNHGEGAVRARFERWNGCTDFWAALVDSNNCEWFRNCSHVEIISDVERILHFSGGPFASLHYETVHEPSTRRLENNVIEHSLLYYIDEIARLTEIILTFDEREYGPDQCEVVTKWWSDPEFIPFDAIYRAFRYSVEPYLQELYEVGKDS